MGEWNSVTTPTFIRPLHTNPDIFETAYVFPLIGFPSPRVNTDTETALFMKAV